MLRFLLLVAVSFNVFAHGGDSGPSSLEQEFSKLAHIHLPVNFSSAEGFSLGFDLGNEEHSGFSVESHPVAFGGFDKITRYTCLSRSEGTEIEACPENSPYQLLENKKWDLGTGLEVHTHLPIGGLSLGIGFGYMKGKTYYSVRQLTHKKEKRSQLQFPVSKDAFSDWRNGDELFYMTKSTVFFNVILEAGPIVHFGPQVSKTGIYRVSLRKHDDHLVAELALIKSKDFSVEGYAMAAGAEFSTGKNKSESLTYEFDMNDDRSYEALAYFLGGRMDSVNSLLQSGDLQARLITDNRGISFSAGFGIPVLYMNGGYRGTYKTSGRYDLKEEDGSFHEHEIHSIAEIRDHFTRGVWSDHRWENSMLSTSVLREKDEPTESLLTVSYNWSFGRDHIRENQLLRKFRKIDLRWKTNLSKLIRLPSNTTGYLKVSLVLSLNGGHVMKLLSVSETKELETFQAKNDYPGLIKKLQKMMARILPKKDFGVLEGDLPRFKVILEGESIAKAAIQL